jgi:hypothetical protein
MANNTNLKLTVEAWAEIVIERWRDKIEKLDIQYSYQLADSFVWDVVMNANGDPQKIGFAFKYYGKFVDMGVGNGVTIGDVGELRASRSADGANSHNRRRPKAWYSKTLAGQVKALARIMAEKYGNKAQLMLYENLDDNTTKRNYSRV